MFFLLLFSLFICPDLQVGDSNDLLLEINRHAISKKMHKKNPLH